MNELLLDLLTVVPAEPLVVNSPDASDAGFDCPLPRRGITMQDFLKTFKLRLPLICLNIYSRDFSMQTCDLSGCPTEFYTRHRERNFGFFGEDKASKNALKQWRSLPFVTWFLPKDRRTFRINEQTF